MINKPATKKGRFFYVLWMSLVYYLAGTFYIMLMLGVLHSYIDRIPPLGYKELVGPYVLFLWLVSNIVSYAQLTIRFDNYLNHNENQRYFGIYT